NPSAAHDDRAAGDRCGGGDGAVRRPDRPCAQRERAHDEVVVPSALLIGTRGSPRRASPLSSNHRSEDRAQLSGADDVSLAFEEADRIGEIPICLILGTPESEYFGGGGRRAPSLV